LHDLVLLQRKDFEVRDSSKIIILSWFVDYVEDPSLIARLQACKSAVLQLFIISQPLIASALFEKPLLLLFSGSEGAKPHDL
jgi:hypothetical protein